jgi:nucleoside-diphosphate-sugar epimerase
MKTLITGATGLTGTFLLQRLAEIAPNIEVSCLVRETSDRSKIDQLNLKLNYYKGDSKTAETWDNIFAQSNFETIIHLVQLNQVPIILNSLKKVQKTPHLIIIGTTGIYSKYNRYAQEYKDAETELLQYSGTYCLMRPTMIYGTPQDQNLHKLIKFCDRYRFFPVFGSGNTLLQPIHADDIAQTLLKAWQSPNIQGAYDLSGASIVTFKELLAIVSKLLAKPVHHLYFPLNIGITMATLSENILGDKSPVRREQILRLQENKAYSHESAKNDLDFAPRTLEIGLQQEIELMRNQGIIKA